MAALKNEVTRQVMADYLSAVKDRANSRNPAETWRDVGTVALDAAVGVTAGAVLNYLTNKSPVPQKLTAWAAESYVRYNAYVHAGQTVESGISYYSGRVGQAYSQFGPKISGILAVAEIGIPTVAWPLYQHNTSQDEVLDVAMQVPAMHHLAKSWQEAEQFKVLASALTSEKESEDPLCKLRHEAIEEASQNTLKQQPVNDLNLLLKESGIDFGNFVLKDTQTNKSHVHFDAYAKAVDRAFYQQIQQTPAFAEPLAHFWKDFKDLGYAIKNPTHDMDKLHERALVTAGSIERTGLADYSGFLTREWKELTLKDLNQSGGAEISGP